jgi:membrane dipeptidase
MKIFLYFLLGSLITLKLWACSLPAEQELTIGCSYQCDFFYRFRLNSTARKLGYRIRIVDMRELGTVASAMDQIDGLLIPGGADIDPRFYTSAVTPELRAYTEQNLRLVNFTKEGQQRDPLEYALVKRYSSEAAYKQLPLLGICRGMQMMSVAQGIPLYLDIKTELGIKNRRHLFDQVLIAQDDAHLMNEIHHHSSVRGFKLHHQGIRVDYYLKHQAEYPLTKVTAYSNRGLIAEALEYTHRPALGVQYHPERSFTSASAPVFRWFLQKACENKNLKEQL